MKISVVINTCALGPRAKEITGSRSTTPHAIRAYALRNFVIPRYVDDPWVSEVIVVGEWEEGEGYTYIHSPSRFFSCVDALDQRQAGFEASSGDLIAFTHDDHVLATDTFIRLPTSFEHDLVLPRRFKRTAEGEIQLPNGASEGYVSGHASLIKREMCERAPWGEVEKIHTWDLSHTKLLAREKAKVVEGAKVYDIELGTTGLEVWDEDPHHGV